jgi:hypothetical protein
LVASADLAPARQQPSDRECRNGDNAEAWFAQTETAELVPDRKSRGPRIGLLRLPDCTRTDSEPISSLVAAMCRERQSTAAVLERYLAGYLVELDR